MPDTFTDRIIIWLSANPWRVAGFLIVGCLFVPSWVAGII